MKTAYANRLSPDELAKATEGMAPEEREQARVENATSPLFDMWLRFEAAFGDRAIDRLDITDADAEAAAKRMEGIGASGAAFAYLLRSIANRRMLRGFAHKASAVWAAGGAPEAMSAQEVHERYAKLPKGES